MKQYILGLVLLCVSIPVFSAIDVYQFDTTQQEALYQQMVDELRCLVCQNQNLSASNAGLAQDLRKQTYQMVMSGKSRADIVNYMTQRYGDFVMYRPPMNIKTLLLWLGPLLLLLIGLLALFKGIISGRSSSVSNTQSKEVPLPFGRLLDEEV